MNHNERHKINGNTPLDSLTDVFQTDGTCEARFIIGMHLDIGPGQAEKRKKFRSLTRQGQAIKSSTRWEGIAIGATPLANTGEMDAKETRQKSAVGSQTSDVKNVNKLPSCENALAFCAAINNRLLRFLLQ